MRPMATELKQLWVQLNKSELDLSLQGLWLYIYIMTNVEHDNYLCIWFPPDFLALSMFTSSSQPLILNINNFQLYCYKYDNPLYYLYFHFIHDDYGRSEIFKLKDVKFINLSVCGLHLDVVF